MEAEPIKVLVAVETVKLENSSIYGSNIVAEKVEFNLKTVVNDSKKLLASNMIDTVKGFISKLINDINSERKNKLLVKHMSMKLEILKALVKTHSMKKEVTF